MRTSFASVSILALAAVGSAYAAKWGNGKLVTFNAEVRGFSSVKASSALRVVIKDGKSHTSRVTLATNLRADFIAAVDGRVLKLGFKPGSAMKRSPKCEVAIPMPVIESLDASGASTILIADAFKGDELKVELSGASRLEGEFAYGIAGLEATGASTIDIEGSFDSIAARLEGASTLKISGKSESFSAELEGASKLAAKGFESLEAEVVAEGASHVRLGSVKEKISIEATGASRVSYSGDPEVAAESLRTSVARRPSGASAPALATPPRARVESPMDPKTSDSFARALGVVERLRAPDGCPWDREQTPMTMRGNLIEESYEAVEAINEGDASHVREELGDVFLLAMMLSYMYEQEGAFTVSEVFDGLSDKLIRRHPHVFGESDADTPDAVVKQWNEIKATVEGRGKKDSLMDEVSHALPPLERAYKLQKKAAKVGFDWLRVEDVWAKVEEELEEAREAASGESHDRREEEIGDLLFSVVNISRFLGVDPMIARHRCVAKFVARFKFGEKTMKEKGEAMSRDTFERMDALWDEAKRQGL